MDKSNLQIDFFDDVATEYGRQWTIEEEVRITAGTVAKKYEGRILEIGCGNGRTLQNLPVDSFGMDFSKNMLMCARKRNPLSRLVLADAQRIPFKKQTFNTVVIVNVIHLFGFYDKVLEEVATLEPKFLIVDFRNLMNPVVFFKSLRSRSQVPYKAIMPWKWLGILKKNGFGRFRLFRIIRPLSDPNEGFKVRHAIGYLISMLFWLAPSYVVAAENMGGTEKND